MSRVMRSLLSVRTIVRTTEFTSIAKRDVDVARIVQRAMSMYMTSKVDSNKEESGRAQVFEQNNTHHNLNETITHEEVHGARKKSDPGDADCGFEHEDGFDTVIRTALNVLVESDIRRGEFSGNSDGSSSQGRWLYDPAAKKLERVLDRLVVCVFQRVKLIVLALCLYWLPVPDCMVFSSDAHVLAFFDMCRCRRTRWM